MITLAIDETVCCHHSHLCLLSTEWVDYVEEPMKYQALRPHFSPWVGGGVWVDGGAGGSGVGVVWVGWGWCRGWVVVGWVGGGVHSVLVMDVVGGGERVGGGMGDGVLSGW